MLSIPSVLILTVTFMSLVQMPICSPLNMPLTYPVRCVEIKMLPLSFLEFLTFHGFEVREIKSSLGGIRKQAFDKNDERYELRDVFDAYMRFGGMPGIADIGLDQEKALMLLEGIYSTVIMRDILERENRKGQSRITDPVLLKKLLCFLLII